MARRVTTGTPGPGPYADPSLANSIFESAEHFAQQKRTGRLDRGGHALIPPTDVVKVRNDSGSARRLGEVLEVDRNSPLLADPPRDISLWFKGVTPDTTRVFGILRKPAQASAIEPLQVSGVCRALVNVTDANHTHATVQSGSYVLQSSGFGPVWILQKPSGTGEKESVVVINGAVPSVVRVQIWTGSGTPTVGNLLAANADGYHPGRLITHNGADVTIGNDVWVHVMDWHSVDEGEGQGAICEHGRHHIGLLEGSVSTGGTAKPRVTIELGDTTYLSQPVADIAKGASNSVRLYNGDETDSGLTATAKALGMAVTADKWTTTARLRGGSWYVGCWEV